ncbi:MAG: hypothetical protein FWC23_02375 [Chitinispirillia bacterium]|nr:hypothetical protein [Chitinispirillia bacterium]MCL2268025.1 hypothetical protein [Chitinispirillia bacterium]
MELKEFLDKPLLTNGDFIEMAVILVLVILISIPLRWVMDVDCKRYIKRK